MIGVDRLEMCLTHFCDWTSLCDYHKSSGRSDASVQNQVSWLGQEKDGFALLWHRSLGWLDVGGGSWALRVSAGMR